MDVDIKDSNTFATLLASILASTSNAGNVNSTGVDTQQYIGQLAARVNIGAQATGGAAATLTVSILSSNTNNIANATAVAATVNTVVSTNNAASATIVIDKRVDHRFVFAQVTTSAVTNTPSMSAAVELIGRKQVQ